MYGKKSNCVLRNLICFLLTYCIVHNFRAVKPNFALVIPCIAPIKVVIVLKVFLTFFFCDDFVALFYAHTLQGVVLPQFVHSRQIIVCINQKSDLAVCNTSRGNERGQTIDFFLNSHSRISSFLRSA